MRAIKEIRARVYFLSTEEGGRKPPAAFLGYHPLFDFGLHGSDGQKMLNGGIIILEDRDRVLPGEECILRIRLARPELLQGVLKPDLSLAVTEGTPQLVGKGTILEVFLEVFTDFTVPRLLLQTHAARSPFLPSV